MRAEAAASAGGSRAVALDFVEPLLDVLAGYVSRPTAQSIVKLARQRVGAPAGPLGRAQLSEMLDTIEANLRLFVQDPTREAECRRALHGLVRGLEPQPPLAAVLMKVAGEDDILRARVSARELAARMGFSPVGQTRLVTAVSELVRNIAQYAGEGQLEIKPTAEPPGLEICARDRGPGIPNVDEIMAGKYKSRIGMGLGLRGVKRIADRFDLQTGAGRGTTVLFTLRVC